MARVDSVPRRRSPRHHPITYDSNGRDYLAALLGRSRESLEKWLASDTVKPHLLLWYHLCFRSSRRFNKAIEWINTGDSGYFYNPAGLEEDLLLMCLGEGNVEDKNTTEIEAMPAYNDEEAVTSSWLTQELWARCAWRIVQANRGPGQVFQRTAIEHPAFAYAFAIDLLCISFHSLAFRRADSIWQQIIADESIGPAGISAQFNRLILPHVKMDQPDGVAEDRAGHADGESCTTGGESTASNSDTEFPNPSEPKTKADSAEIISPKAPARKLDSKGALAANEQYVRNWMENVASRDSRTLGMIDAETGEPIKGYRGGI